MSVRKQLEDVLEKLGEISMDGSLVTVDRGYDKYEIIKEFFGMGFGVIRVVPSDRNDAHLFVTLL